MRSLVSDLIPEYNKKLQFFLKRHRFMLWKRFYPSPAARVFTVNQQLYRKLSVLYHTGTFTRRRGCDAWIVQI